MGPARADAGEDQASDDEVRLEAPISFRLAGPADSATQIAPAPGGASVGQTTEVGVAGRECCQRHVVLELDGGIADERPEVDVHGHIALTHGA